MNWRKASLPPLLALATGKPARARKAPAYRPVENKLHVDVANLLRAHCLPEWEWTHFPAGEKRTLMTGARLKRMGLNRGWPDFILLSPNGLFHGLEIKRRGLPLTDEQEEFR